VIAALVGGVVLVACTAPASEEVATQTGGGLRLISSAFAPGGPIPEEHTCDGDDVSPPLTWDGVPDGTDSFALIVTDPDAGNFVHWVLTDIPADVRELAAGVGDQVGTPGRNGFGDSGWGGPCPPSGEHRYVFELLAVSEPLRLGSGATGDRVRSVASGATLARGELTGVYARR
jgi:Raf kinase inhibitor-like YbhB/YbcL family protein